MRLALRHTLRVMARVALSHYVANGMLAALGLLCISSLVDAWLGPFAGACASVGVVVCIPPDQPGPQRGKFYKLLPALLLGAPLFYSVQWLHASALATGLLLVPATFVAFLAGAWGKRGLPIATSIMFAMIFSMAVPQRPDGTSALQSTEFFILGAGLYLIWASVGSAWLNTRLRSQLLADTLLNLALLMRLQAARFVQARQGDVSQAPLGQHLLQQAALSEQLQSARDVLLESPRSTERQRLATMLLRVLDLRDHLLACALDLDIVHSQGGHHAVLQAMQAVLLDLSDQIEALADALLWGHQVPSAASLAPRLAALHSQSDQASHASAMLARGLANRLEHINDETLRLIALARQEREPDLAGVRAAWQLFVSPAEWSWQPVRALWTPQAPALRHAVRATLAIGSAYLIALALPGGTHDYWILLTIVVVLRGSLAQTLERRNSRVAGTVLGCVIAGLVLGLHASPLTQLLVLTLSQGLAHAFALRRYLVTAVAATVLGLLQAHLLHAGASPTFDMLERIVDTLIGVGLAWLFSYVLPSWERKQVPALIERTLKAQARHAQVALGLAQLRAGDNEPELAWRLARREAHDSLSALVQAVQRSLVEPRAVRVELGPMKRLVTSGYQLLAQLTAVKTMLLLRRERLEDQHIQHPLEQAAQAILAGLTGPATPGSTLQPPLPEQTLPDPFDNNLNPWVLRRLGLASALAQQMRQAADEVLALLTQASDFVPDSTEGQAPTVDPVVGADNTQASPVRPVDNAAP